MSASIKIDRMRAEDARAAAEITERALGVRWTEAMYLAELADDTKRYFVARAGDVVVGFVGAQYVLDNADITNIAVREDARRTGIGRELLNALTADAKARGILSLTLEVSEYNTIAAEFYRGMGFVQNGRRRGYYADGAAAVLLTKSI